VRRYPSGIWFLIGIGFVAFLVSRMTRSMGPAGIIITIALVIVLFGIARDLLRTRAGTGAPDPWTAATKNVTPHEPALPPGLAPRRDPASDPAPPVVIVEPPDATEALQAKLRALDRLRADGLVTEAEYEAKRARLIADF
jgi:hypothetical protein